MIDKTNGSNFEVLNNLYTLLKEFIYHYISYKELHKYFKSLPGDREFWVYTSNAHLKVAIITWHMIYCSDSYKDYWDELKPDEKGFTEYFFKESRVNKEDWEDCLKSIEYYYNAFAVHKISKYQIPIPVFDIAYKAIMAFDIWISDYISGPTFEELAKKYKDDISMTLLNIIGKV